VDSALAKRDAINRFLQQTVDYSSTAEEADGGLVALVADAFVEEADGSPAMVADDALPSVVPGPSAIPPLNLAV
jgi:hypothetical protein